jgi:ABC-type antimicrobial peptide transport system permease subunit
VCIGLYGIVGYSVARRVNEMGLRMALGAKPANVLWLVMRESLWLVGAGLLIGVPIALASAHAISALLFGLTPVDPLSLAFSILMLLVFSAMAGYIPARRASRVDPMVALRYE